MENSASVKEISLRNHLKWKGKRIQIKGDFLEKAFLESKVKGLHSVLGPDSKTEIAVLILVRNLIKRCKLDEAESIILRHFEMHGSTAALLQELSNIRQKSESF